MRVTITDQDQIAAIAEILGRDDMPAQLVISGPTGKTQRPCACGCGHLTARTWAPGHDATHKKALYEVIRAGGEKAQDARDELVARGWPQPVIRTTTTEQVA